MATDESTMSLGLRFRRHVAGWVMDSVPTPPPGELEALEARADAAERGMVAFAEDVTGDNWHRIVAERTEALAAWRALGEVQP